MFCLSACEYLKASFTAEAASAAAMQDAAVIGASIVAVISAVKAAYSINCKYEACQTKINSLQSEFNILRNKVKEKYPMLENLNEKMGRLNVVSINDNSD